MDLITKCYNTVISEKIKVSKGQMFVLVGCHRAAPKYCFNMWWLVIFSVIFIKTFGVSGSNSTGVIPMSKFRLFYYKVGSIGTQFFYIRNLVKDVRILRQLLGLILVY